MKKVKEKIKKVNNHFFMFGKKNIQQFSAYFTHIIWLFIIFTFSSFIIFLIFFLLATKSYERSLERSRAEIKEYYYWSQVVKKHPKFPAALIQAARYSLALGYKEEALSYLEKAIAEDPKSQKAHELRRIILEER